MNKTISRFLAMLPTRTHKGKSLAALPYAEAKEVAEKTWRHNDMLGKGIAERAFDIQSDAMNVCRAAMALQSDAMVVESDTFQRGDLSPDSDSIGDHADAYYQALGELLAKTYAELMRISIAQGIPFGITLANAQSYYMSRHEEQK